MTVGGGNGRTAYATPCAVRLYNPNFLTFLPAQNFFSYFAHLFGNGVATAANIVTPAAAPPAALLSVAAPCNAGVFQIYIPEKNTPILKSCKLSASTNSQFSTLNSQLLKHVHTHARCLSKNARVRVQHNLPT
jgi:hypothetical protein